MINISNCTSVDNTPRLPVQLPGPTAATGAPTRTPASDRGSALAVAGRILLSWLAGLPRRLGDRLFVMNDTEAYWRSWQITRTHGGLGRRYRDPRFDTLAECRTCRGTGRATGHTAGAKDHTTDRAKDRTAGLPCARCLGTGRITLGEVS